MIYVCLDSCIYNRLVTQGRPGSTMECFEELKKLTTEGKVRVVLPEVVVLECDKFILELDTRLLTAIEGIKTGIANVWEKKPRPWNEIEDLKDFLVAHIDAEAAKKKKKAFADRVKVVKEWLTSTNAISVPFESDVWLKAQRRLISGRMPPSDKNSSDHKRDQDASIIESLLKALPKDAELFFASENVNDFAVELPNKGFAFHPLLAEDFPKTRYFTDLCSLVETVTTGRIAPEPTEEELEQAVRHATVRPHFFTLLLRIRPLIERFVESSETGEINYIRNPRLHELYCSFSMSWELDRDQFPEIDDLCRAIHHTLTEMMKHNKVIEYEAVRLKRGTESHEAALERLAATFLDQHDELMDQWNARHA